MVAKDRYTEGGAFLCTFKYISGCFQSVVCIECLHLLLKDNFCEKEIFCIVGTPEKQMFLETVML